MATVQKKEPEVIEEEVVEVPEEAVDDAAEEVADADLPSLDDAAEMEAVAAEPAPQAKPVAPAPTLASAAGPAPMQAAPAPEPTATPAAPATPQEEAQKLTQDNINFSRDLRFGHVKPQTYGDLFGKKETLGKAGTLFGLLLSGVGSGLTGQPNAVLSMMDKEIERDFEAQKTDQANKQNWYKAAIEKERAESENNLRNVNAVLGGTDASFNMWRNAQAGVNDVMATTNALNYSTAAYIQSQQALIDKMPPGPTKDLAQNKMDTEIVPYFLNKVAQRNEIAASKKAAINAANPAPQAKVGTLEAGPVDQKSYQNMTKMGAILATKGIVDPSKGIDPSDNGIVTKAITDSKVNWANYGDVIHAANMLAEMKRFGQPPLGAVADVTKKVPWLGDALAAGVKYAQGDLNRQRDILVDALSNRLAGHGASDQTIQDMKRALTPNMFDNQDTVKSLERTIYEHFAHNDKEQNAIFTKYPRLKREIPEQRIKYEEGLAKQKEKDSGEAYAGKGSEKKKESGVADQLLEALNKITGFKAVAGEKK